MSGDMESFPFISLSLGRREMMGIMRLSIYLMARMRNIACSILDCLEFDEARGVAANTRHPFGERGTTLNPICGGLTM